MTPEQIDHMERATERARAVLKPGDWLTVRNCGDSRSRVRMTGWDGDWICSRTRSDIHALHVLKVNGDWIGFDDLSHQANECIRFGDPTLVPDVFGGIAVRVAGLTDYDPADPRALIEKQERVKLRFTESPMLRTQIGSPRKFRIFELAGGYCGVIDIDANTIVEIHLSRRDARVAIIRLEEDAL